MPFSSVMRGTVWFICLCLALVAGILSAQEDRPPATADSASPTRQESPGTDADEEAVGSDDASMPGIGGDYYLPDLSLEEMPETPPGPVGPQEATAPPPGPPAEIQAQDETGPTVLAAPIQLLGVEIFGGQSSELKWTAGQSFGGRSLDTPVLVAHGLKRGPVLCLMAAIHGDELNGVEIVRRVMSDLDPQQLSGTVIGVPIVNLLGFLRASRYLPDRRDLNRYFPGNPRGSAASRIAYLFFHQIARNCNYLVDLHTGSLDRTNLPQLRADLSDPNVFRFTEFFGATSVLHQLGAAGTLRRAAGEAGIPAVTFELGEPQTLQVEHVDFGVLAIETLIDKLGMMDRMRHWSEKQPVFYASRWVRSDQGGILLTSVRLGAKVKEGDILGTVTNPLSNEVMQVRSPFDGRVIGMALNQFVLPGFAAFHIGIATREPDELLKSELESGTPPDATMDLPETMPSPEEGEGDGEQPEFD
jgi:hypothetical protein